MLVPDAETFVSGLALASCNCCYCQASSCNLHQGMLNSTSIHQHPHTAQARVHKAPVHNALCMPPHRYPQFPQVQEGSAISRAATIIQRFFAHCDNPGCVPATGRTLHSYDQDVSVSRRLLS
jgi:hypothetical protein